VSTQNERKDTQTTYFSTIYNRKSILFFIRAEVNKGQIFAATNFMPKRTAGAIFALLKNSDIQ
jgi:hypothetical protein